MSPVLFEGRVSLLSRLCARHVDLLLDDFGLKSLCLLIFLRYGPPPAYPRLKIPGLNAPIPPGCSYGYHAGGWGKPPVNEFGQPLYEADGTGAEEEEDPEADMGIAMLWGELPDGVEEEEEEDEGEKSREFSSSLFISSPFFW